VPGIFSALASSLPDRWQPERAMRGFKAICLEAILATAVGVVGATAFAATDTTGAPTNVEEIVITGELRSDPLDSLPSSISVATSQQIAALNAQHLEQVLALMPNVNFASGASRARYLQIRGIGETGQFIAPLNPSVGLIVDHVDFSGIGTISTTYDVRQIEVFRGPQGTLYGANALAGLVNITTNDPTDVLEAGATVEGGDYDTRSIGAYVSGPLLDSLDGRIAAQQYRSDGYVHNDYLHRDDTNDYDELTLRGKLRWRVGDDTVVDLAGGYIDIDNGYDAFSLDNKRDTISDQPGKDTQKSRFGSVVARFSQPQSFHIETVLAHADSDIDYGYDEDWTFVGFDPNGYSSTDLYRRDVDTTSAEIRFVSNDAGRLLGDSTDWAVGVYGLKQDMTLHRVYTFVTPDFTSAFRIERAAIFGQTETHFSDVTNLTVGLRLERHDSDYHDVDGARFEPDDNLWGGRIALEHLVRSNTMVYASFSRGYKSGGFNTDGSLDRALREFDPETLYNAELGVKGSWLDDAAVGRVALFYMWRQDMQVDTSKTLMRPDGSSEFVEYTGNASQGNNYGLEAELRYRPTAHVELFTSLGLLASEYDNFVNGAGQQLDGRQQAQAPSYQFFASGQYTFTQGWFLRAAVQAKDAYYFSDSDSFQSEPYELLHLSAGVQRGNWELSAWMHNVFDEHYEVKGYYFGNDPRIDYQPRGYTQFGEPRRVGVTLDWHL
jgi:iron complex outermembrane recepter protein